MELAKTIAFTLFTMIFTENIVFSRALGGGTILAVASDRKSIFGFAAGVTYMSVVSDIFAWAVEFSFGGSAGYGIYRPVIYTGILGILYSVTLMSTYAFFRDKLERIKKYMHFSVFNCAVMGNMLLSTGVCHTFTDYLFYGIGSGLGYSLAVYAAAAVYEKAYSEDVPAVFRGFPLMIIYMGIIGMALFGLSGRRMSF